MKNRNLNPEEKDVIENKYEEHIYFRLLKQSCKKYERELSTFRFSPEDVFLESLYILDDLKAPNKNKADKCDMLWDDLYCDFRERGENIPKDELDKAVAVVVTVVYYALNLTESVFYNSMTGRLILTLNEHYKGFTQIQNDIHYQAQKIGFGELQRWIVEYMNFGDYLSEELEDCLEEMDEDCSGSEKSCYRIAEKHKTNFAKILSAMYELKMFEDDKGLIASNKQNLISSIGRFFNLDYKNLPQLLNAAKQNGNYTDIFDKLKEKAKDFDKK